MRIIGITARPHERKAFAVTGDSGSEYTVAQMRDNNTWHCTCPAFRYAHTFPIPKGSQSLYISNRKPCKHIEAVVEKERARNPRQVRITVEERIQGNARSDTFYYTAVLTPQELESLHDLLEKIENAHGTR